MSKYISVPVYVSHEKCTQTFHRNFATRPLNYTGVSKLLHLAFEALWLRNEATYRTWSVYDGPLTTHNVA